MITPILDNNDLVYINSESIFLEISDIDEKFYYFDLYFDFDQNLMLKDNILNVNFELVDNSLIPTNEEINEKLLKNNLPLEDELNPEFFNKKVEVINFKSSLYLKSVIFNKTVNITKAINNSNKFGELKSFKLLKEKINNLNLKEYKKNYLENNGQLSLENFKHSIERDFLFKKIEINKSYLNLKESFKLEKNKLNSNSLSVYLNLDLKNSSDKIYKKEVVITDLLDFFSKKNDLFFNVKTKKDKNSILVQSKKSSKIKIIKKNIINNTRSTLYEGSIENQLKIDDINNPLKNVVYYIEENYNSIKEFIINNDNNDYFAVLYCHNKITGISIVAEIKNNTDNDSFILKRRNISKNQTKFDILGSYNNSFSYEDNFDLKNDHIYEYTLFNNNDQKNEVAKFFIKRFDPKFKSSEFTIEKNSLIDDFQIKIDYNNSENNFISILKNFDLYDQYLNELSQNKDNIKNLFYYKIDRLNKVTGEFINLGWITSNFSDKISSETNGVRQIEKNNNYLYFITAYNVISTMFIEEIPQKIKSKSGREYIYDKNKWSHPLIKDNAISSDPKTRYNLFGKFDYEFGIPGETILIDGSLNQNNLITSNNEISNLEINRKYKNYVILEWIVSEQNSIDHILITKTNEYSYEELVDKINIKNGRNIYFYRIDDNDKNLQFSIIPISQDLSFKNRYYFKVIEL